MIDFVDAARRHLNDAGVLDAAQCEANAGHLYGLAAECGLKAVMVARGKVAVEPNGDLKDPVDRFHVNKVALAIAQGVDSRLENQFASRIPSIASFSNSRVEHRYYAGTAIPPRLADWRTAAFEVGAMLQWAQTGGMI